MTKVRGADTELLTIQPLSADVIGHVKVVLDILQVAGLGAALQSDSGKHLVATFQVILDEATKGSKDPISFRLGATSANDSFANGAPTTKPGPMDPDADLVLRRILTRGRAVSRLRALTDNLWGEDPGEALIVQRWSAAIELQREIRVFCQEDRVTAASHDMWWEKAGWRERYTDGFVEAIASLWDQVKGHLPFDTCTMDVLMASPTNGQPWTAKLIEFNGFGAHLNTDSDLFHLVKDADHPPGKSPGVTVRFVDDWENAPSLQEETVAAAPPESVSLDEDEPDWLVLEKQFHAKFADEAEDGERRKLPLRDRWCSAY